jgi:transposase-like protein
MEAKRKHIIYKEEFRRQAVEMVIHSGKTQAQVARELGCSEYSLNLWKRAYLGQIKPVLKKAISIRGEEPNPGMR